MKCVCVCVHVQQPNLIAVMLSRQRQTSLIAAAASISHQRCSSCGTKRLLHCFLSLWLPLKHGWLVGWLVSPLVLVQVLARCFDEEVF